MQRSDGLMVESSVKAEPDPPILNQTLTPNQTSTLREIPIPMQIRTQNLIPSDSVSVSAPAPVSASDSASASAPDVRVEGQDGA